MQINSTQQPIIDRLLWWWHIIAAPPEVPDDASLPAREIVRHGKLTSATLLIEFIYITIVIGVGFTSNHALLPILIANYVAITVAVVCNRYQKTHLAAVIAFFTLEASMILNIVNLSLAKGLSSFNLSLLDILAQPLLIAVSLFPAWVALPITAFNCVLIAGCLAFLPKTPELVHLLSTASYNAYERPIALQVITGLVTYLWVSSAIGGMKRAGRAEEVNKLVQALAMQQQAEVQEKQQFEKSIEQIVNVHTQVANGNFGARVPLKENDVLWSIAGSLNNLLARVQRWRQDSSQLQRTEQAIHQLQWEIQQARIQGRSLQVRRTGTALDLLLQELVSTELSTQPPAHSPAHISASTPIPPSEKLQLWSDASLKNM
jgi:hypothetical protein